MKEKTNYNKISINFKLSAPYLRPFTYFWPQTYGSQQNVFHKALRRELFICSFSHYERYVAVTPWTNKVLCSCSFKCSLKRSSFKYFNTSQSKSRISRILWAWSQFGDQSYMMAKNTSQFLAVAPADLHSGCMYGPIRVHISTMLHGSVNPHVKLDKLSNLQNDQSPKCHAKQNVQACSWWKLLSSLLQ